MTWLIFNFIIISYIQLTITWFQFFFWFVKQVNKSCKAVMVMKIIIYNNNNNSNNNNNNNINV